MLMTRPIVWMFSVGIMLLGANAVCGQNYPNKPIRIVTGSVGAGGDFDARIVAQGISGPLGQPVIVDNRGNGVLAGEILSKAPPDGYTLSVAGGTVWTYQLLYKAPYDVLRDFSAITLIERTVHVLAVHPALPVTSVKELIALAKARPGELNFSAGSIAGGPHLASELFKSMAGIAIVHVPYKGSAAAVTALIGGEVQMTIIDAGLVVPHIKSGKLRALAVTSAEPTALLPNLPTIAASGLPGYEAVGKTGMFAPAKTPQAIITRLNQEISRVLNREDVKEKFLSIGSEVVNSSPEQFASAVKADIAKLGKMIREAGIKAN